MLLLPIVDRELRVAARSWRTYFTRVTSGAAALCMAMYLVWLARTAIGGPTAGMFILKATSYMAWAICIFGGISRTCDTLSSEKREDTLGLLFLTHLKGYDVVLAKLLANCLNAFFLLFGLLPILSIPVLLGGVSGTEMIRIPLVLLNSLFLAACVGLLVSSLVRGQKAASGLAGGAVVFLAVLLPVMAQLVEREFQQPEWARVLRMPSPLCLLEMAFVTAFGLSTNDFWKALGLQFGLAGLALYGACKIAPRSWMVQNNPLANWTERFYRWTHGSPGARAERRERFLARNPFYWLICRDRFAPMWPIVFGMVTMSATLWCVVHYEIPSQPAFGLLLAAVAVNDLTMRMRVASLGATQLAQDRQSGALEIIMSTPVTVREVMRGVWMAIRHIQLPAYGILLLAYGIVSFGFLHSMEASVEGVLVMVLFALISMGDFMVMGYVAMWKGMQIANSRYSAGSATVRVLIAPWFIWLGLLPLIQGVGPVRRFFDAHEPYSYVLTGLAVWTISAGAALVTARRNLARHFREAVTDRFMFERKFSFWRRWGRWVGRRPYGS